MRKAVILLALGLFACDNKLSKERCEKFYTHIGHVVIYEHPETVNYASSAMKKAMAECPKDKYDCVMGSATTAEIEKCLTPPAP
jgi:hypothetical protein